MTFLYGIGRMGRPSVPRFLPPARREIIFPPVQPFPQTDDMSSFILMPRTWCLAIRMGGWISLFATCKQGLPHAFPSIQVVCRRITIRSILPSPRMGTTLYLNRTPPTLYPAIPMQGMIFLYTIYKQG